MFWEFFSKPLPTFLVKKKLIIKYNRDYNKIVLQIFNWIYLRRERKFPKTWGAGYCAEIFLDSYSIVSSFFCPWWSAECCMLSSN